MKRLVLLVSLVLLLLLAACGTQPESQEVLPTDAAATAAVGGEATPAPEVADESGQIVPGLAGTTWEWVETVTPAETITAVDPARYVITFNEDGTMAITADCNSVTGTYTADETGAMTITLGASTAVGCPEDTQDQVFLAGLAGAAGYFMQAGSNDLYIDQIADAGTLRFRPVGGMEAETGAEAAPAGSLTGVTWEWVSLVDPLGQTTASDPTRYTVTFNEDGTANVVADCNNLLAEYLTDGSNIEITPGGGTLMACEPGSQDSVFLNSLVSSAIYTVEDGELFLDLQADSGTLIFRQAATAAGEGEMDGTTTASPPTLVGPTWEWVDTTTPVETITAADPTRYTVTFMEDGTAAITADCNTGSGTYTAAEDGTMTFTPGALTRMACPEDSQADAFLAALSSVANYFFQDDFLYIDQVADAGTLRFRAAGLDEGMSGEGTTEATLMTDGTWQWVETTTPVETITAADPTRYTITFNKDGTAAIKADCNQVTATYTSDDSTLSIIPGASTLAMCPEDSQATQFVTGLSSAATYFFQDGHLFIDQFASAGTLKLAPVGMGVAPEGEGETGAEPEEGETAPGSAGLVGTVWQLTRITRPNGEITINDPTRYSISFNDDGTANLTADCNVGGATYTMSEGNLLSITPTVSTMAFCGAGSFDQIFLGGLTNAMGYRLEGGSLLIDMLYESGTMIFTPGS